MAYRSVTFKSVVDGVFSLAGVTRSTAANPDALLAQVIDHVNLRIREAWEHDFWPELCPVEERHWRDTWDETETYAEAAEVWFPNADTEIQGYYSANSAPNTPAAGESPETDPTKWTRLEDFRAYIALDQTDQTPIGEAIGLYACDPLRNGWRGRMGFTLSADGIVPAPCAGDSAWLHFRERPVEYTAADYANATPADFPVPAIFAGFVKRAAFADFLRQDAKFEEGGRAEAKARAELINASDAAGASQGQYTTAGVCTY